MYFKPTAIFGIMIGALLGAILFEFSFVQNVFGTIWNLFDLPAIQFQVLGALIGGILGGIIGFFRL